MYRGYPAAITVELVDFTHHFTKGFLLVIFFSYGQEVLFCGQEKTLSLSEILIPFVIVRFLLTYMNE